MQVGSSRIVITGMVIVVVGIVAMVIAATVGGVVAEQPRAR